MKKHMIVLLLLSSCAHYSPVDMGQGEFSDKELLSCSHKILGFPYSPEKQRIDVILKKHKLNSDDVYSIEKRQWPYFWPLYAQDCTVVSLNKKGLAKIGTKHVQSVTPEKALDQNLLECKPDQPKMKFHNLTITCYQDCERAHPVNRKKCETSYKKLLQKQ